jgi:hypothetical protein
LPRPLHDLVAALREDAVEAAVAGVERIGRQPVAQVVDVLEEGHHAVAHLDVRRRRRFGVVGPLLGRDHPAREGHVHGQRTVAGEGTALDGQRREVELLDLPGLVAVGAEDLGGLDGAQDGVVGGRNHLGEVEAHDLRHGHPGEDDDGQRGVGARCVEDHG